MGDVYWSSEATIAKDSNNGLLYILSGRSWYITPPFDFPPYSNIYPNWRSATTPGEADSFVYDAIVGFSGRENKVFDRIKEYDYYYNYGLVAVAGTYKVIYSDCPSTNTPPDPPNPTPNNLYLGTAAPPPPPPKNMNCCDCNTIATIVEDQTARQIEAVRDHIDRRTREELQTINKMLQGMQIDLDLQPIINRLNEVEANLWNGPGR